VTERQRSFGQSVQRTEEEIRMAQTAGLDAYQNLTFAGRGFGCFFNGERSAGRL
jgi:hypothetical protein